MTEKVANYSPELTAQVVEAYQAGEAVASIAERIGKTTRSVIAKLSKEGVYKAKEYATKTGDKPVAKEELASKIGYLAGLNDGEADSLTKANKTALIKILAELEKLPANP